MNALNTGMAAFSQLPHDVQGVVDAAGIDPDQQDLVADLKPSGGLDHACQV